MALTFPHLPTRGAVESTRNFESLQKWLRESPGPWKNPEGFSGKLTETTTVQVRKELGGTVARLKGSAKATEAIPAGTTLFTLPEAFRPSVAARAGLTDVTAGTVVFMEITSTGIVKTEEIIIAHVIGFDSITWNLSTGRDLT